MENSGIRWTEAPTIPSFCYPDIYRLKRPEMLLTMKRGFFIFKNPDATNKLPWKKQYFECQAKTLMQCDAEHTLQYFSEKHS